MKKLFVSFKGGIYAELQQLKKAHILILLTIVQAITFLFLVTLFALTGSLAPTAVISNDSGPMAQAFIDQLSDTHHSFAVKEMDPTSAQKALNSGKLVAIITIPENFSSSIAQRVPVNIDVQIDNVNTDFTDDIRRALPAAIVAFGNKFNFEGISVKVDRNDLIPYDTSYIAYLVVSALALNLFIICGILNGVPIAREFELGTVKYLSLAPVHPLIPILGRSAITVFISFGSILMATAIVIWGFGIHPEHPVSLVLVLFICTLIFSCTGIALGCVVKRILPLVTIVFGISIPLYLISGSLEPERFDGNALWIIGHLSPVYSAVALLENVFHGFKVTPESIPLNVFMLLLWAIATLTISFVVLKRKFAST